MPAHRPLLRRSLLAISGALTFGTRLASAASDLAEIDFATDRLGARPSGFVTARTGGGAPGDWRIVADDTAPRGRVLAQISADPTDYRFPMAIHANLSAANVDVSVRFKPVSGRLDRAAGIAIRLLDADNYYVVRANALEDNVNFYRVVKGSRREIAGTTTKIPTGVWQSLGLKATGNGFSISLNGTVLFTTTDLTFTRAGRIALWTKADSVTHFDALRVQPLA